MSNEGKVRDLVLAPYEFAYTQDQTKGSVAVCTGGMKQTLEETDQPVVFNAKTKRFERTTIDRATQVFKIAPEGWYLSLKNPSDNDGDHPETGRKVLDLPNLVAGKKVNIPGPVSFALWPGQMAKIIKGHHL